MKSYREQWQNVPRSIWNTKGYQISSLLDSGSDVTLIWQSYFGENLIYLVKVHSGGKSEAHTLFHLTVANDEQLPITKYIELDLNFMGLMVPRGPGPKTLDKITRSSRMESGVLSFQEIHKIIWNYSF